jgi:hypothetical protein
MRLALAPGVWLIHFTVVYVLASVACERLVLGTAAATGMALAIYLGAGIADYRRSRDAESGQTAFISRTSVLLCAFSALATLWVAYPAFVLPPCAS